MWDEITVSPNVEVYVWILIGLYTLIFLCYELEDYR